jgi:methionyl-tRNA formyltransferase
MKIAYCGYDFFKDCLKQLIDDGHEILEIFSFPTDNKYDFNDFIFSFANSIKAPIRLSGITQEDVERLSKAGCEMILSAAYPYKIPLSDKIPYFINLHPSPLPNGKGAWPLPYAILSNQKQWGITFHELSENWDAGDIILQKHFDLQSDETLESLSVKCQLSAKDAITDFIESIESLFKNKKTQTTGSYIKMPSRADKTINWDSSVGQIERTVRAFSKFEARAVVEGKTIYIQDVTVWETVHQHLPGTLIMKTNKELVIAAKNGIVCVRFWNFLLERI